MKSGLRTIGYARVSTAGQATEGYSLEAQKQKIKAYCALHELELTEIVEDAGLSGKSISGRPGIQRVLELVRTGKVDNVVIFKLDRMARNLKEACEIAELLEKKKVSLHSISERIDSGSATGRLFYNILSAMAAWEREIISERTKTALAVKRENGQRISGHASYGFQFEDGKLVPNAHERAVIAKVYELHCQGNSIRGIATFLESHGYRNRNDKPFGRNEVWTILKKAA
ncbi:MAG: recombinase family protein [Desulfomonilaceae bacterium]